MDDRRLIRTLLALLVSTVSAWSVEYESITFEGKRHTVCRVDLRKERLKLFLRDEKGIPLRRFSVLEAWLQARNERLIFAMNAGMYHGDMSPVGLFAAEGKQIAPLNLENAPGNFFLKPNGVFLTTAAGAAVVESSQVLAVKGPIDLATQSGPLLVLDGKLHPAFKFESTSELFRNGVGVHSPMEVVFVISEDPVNFHHFARFFRDHLACPNALFFDGTVSSLFSTELKRNDFRIDLGPIIGVTEEGPKHPTPNTQR